MPKTADVNCNIRKMLGAMNPILYKNHQRGNANIIRNRGWKKKGKFYQDRKQTLSIASFGNE
jgi:hypothetical protein